MTDEPGVFELERRLGDAKERLCSAISLWETTRAIARKRTVPITVAQRKVESFVTDFALGLVPIGDPEARAAIAAHDRYGKGTGHPAQLNMGDCFAYACARTNDATLLYEGNDFSKTDIG